MLDHQPSIKDNFTVTGKLYLRLRRHRPDVLITHTPYANVLEQTIAAAAGISKRIAVHHSPFSSYPWPARMADLLLCYTGVYSGIVMVSEAVKRSTPYKLKCYSKRTR